MPIYNISQLTNIVLTQYVQNSVNILYLHQKPPISHTSHHLTKYMHMRARDFCKELSQHITTS